MSTLYAYQNRIAIHGGTKRNAAFIREARYIDRKIKDSLSYHEVLIDGIKQDVAIVNSDNYNEKTMFSMPGDDFHCGGLVEFADNRWLITEKDANNELYTRVKLLQCNHYLHWVDTDGVLHEQWCVIEDGTKYLTGEYEDRNFVVTRGDSRIAMTIARNEHTAKLGRETRFIIDDPLSGDKLAYLLTKPLKVGHVYNNEGIFSFVLQEVVSTDNDNFELEVADYYKYFPREDEDPDDTEQEHINPEEPIIDEPSEDPVSGKKVWL